MFLLEDIRSFDALALYDERLGRNSSYGELAEQVIQFGGRYKSVQKSLIFLFCANSASCVVAYLAAIEAGHAVALLDDKLTWEFKRKLIDRYRPDFVVSATAPEDLDDDFTLARDENCSLFHSRRLCPTGAEIHPDLALLLSTSGSTGTAKFVRLTRANVESNARSIAKALSINGAEKAITSLPLHYSYGLSVLNSHLSSGAAIVLTDEGLMSPQFWELFRRQGCTSLAGVPYSYQMLRRLGLEKLAIPSLKTLTQAGGKLDNSPAAEFHTKMVARGGRFFTMYGQTEACARIAILPHERLPEKLGSVGKAIPGGTISIDEDEIVYRGPNVMMGYAESRKDLALGDDLNGCLRTGDLGCLDADGYLTVTGRRKRDAKIFGLRLNLDEVEQMLREHGPAAVVSRNEKLFVYCEYGNEQELAAHRRALAARLQIHFGALEFRRIRELPLQPNGKINYQELQAQS